MLREAPSTPKQVEKILDEIITISTKNDFIIFEVLNVDSIATHKKYPGIGAAIIAHIKNTKTTFHIDLGIGDIIIPHQEKRKIPTQLVGFKSPLINTYSIETTIAEKIDAILDLMEYSSRMKDYYDIYYLCNKFNFDGAILTKALSKTFSNRDHSFSVKQFNSVLEFSNNDAMQNKWKAFIHKIDLPTNNFDNILQTMKTFLLEPLQASCENTEFKKIWNASAGKWK